MNVGEMQPIPIQASTTALSFPLNSMLEGCFRHSLRALRRISKQCYFFYLFASRAYTQIFSLAAHAHQIDLTGKIEKGRQGMLPHHEKHKEWALRPAVSLCTPCLVLQGLTIGFHNYYHR